MASLYKKPVVKTDRKTGKKIKGKSAKWWGRYRDALGIEKRVPLAKDKSAAQSMLNELVRKVELEKAGRLDPFEEHAKRPLREHVRDFETYLQHKGNSKQHVHDTVTRIRTTIEGCHAVKIVDVTASCVQAYLADRRSAGLAIETSIRTLSCMISKKALSRCQLRPVPRPHSVGLSRKPSLVLKPIVHLRLKWCPHWCRVVPKMVPNGSPRNRRSLHQIAAIRA